LSRSETTSKLTTLPRHLPTAKDVRSAGDYATRDGDCCNPGTRGIVFEEKSVIEHIEAELHALTLLTPVVTTIELPAGQFTGRLAEQVRTAVQA